ncbi:glycoside hydrolase family 172 protein [Auraticoccus monumenti]|uniref:DUF2961 domain-containing protein n=1 Tax=Auraticoccus monumenti TaxID=675864 RepID=A0A1G7D3R1_9ACTN|nr:glycoside hydrolase family 172 protein [Auraticoccus monumenti]SDE46242.1 Protein of unknown function [Auraticoccus monumenti]
MFPDISQLRSTVSRSICPENPDGSPGGAARAVEGTGAHAARDLGLGWKVSPSVEIAPGETFVLGEIDSPGRITHIWLTTAREAWRSLVLRAHWDGDEEPAVETPVGDFFASGWCRFAQVSSQVVASNPHGGFNSYWPMPFQRSARLTLENLSPEKVVVYYQIDYEVGEDVPGPDAGYLHAQFRRSDPLPERTTHPILDVTGRGHYAGTYLAWGVRSPGWWGEGEVKFYVDDDGEFPSIASTGTEDYFGGAWNFDVPGQGYTEFSTPYLGMPQVLRPDGLYASQQRFGLYRWHLPDPITFRTGLRVDVQALGWKSGHRYLPLRDDIASTAVFYLDATHTRRPTLPDLDALAV